MNTYNPDLRYEMMAAIITYLFREWAWKAPDLEAAAREYWNPTSTSGSNDTPVQAESSAEV